LPLAELGPFGGDDTNTLLRRHAPIALRRRFQHAVGTSDPEAGRRPKFPENRENNREFFRVLDLFWRFLTSIHKQFQYVENGFPVHPEQGIFLARTGNSVVGAAHSQPPIIDVVYLFDSMHRD
jgi:hypothetical protein